MNLDDRRPPIIPMPKMPVLEPWVPLPTLADYLERPADHPLIHRAMEHVPLEHFREEDRALSGLAACWVATQVDPRYTVKLFVLLQAACPTPDLFQYVPSYKKKRK